MANELIDHNEIVDELDNKLVAQHNDLIKSVADMKKTSMKIFEIAVGALDTEKTQKRSVAIKKKIIYDLLNQKGHDRNERLRNALKELQHNAVFHLMPSEENGNEEVLISPISKIAWDNRGANVKITFTSEILPYITFLKENFTQYKLEYIAKMESKYSIVLYKLFAMNYNHYRYYRDKGNMRHEQLEKYQNPTYSVRELHEKTGTSNKYLKRFGDFKKNVLDKAVNEINKKTDLIVSYDKIRSGRYISDIQFHIDKKNADASVEDMKHIGTVQQTKQEREMENAKIYADAMSSEYTQMLMTRMLLNPTDMTNQQTMTYLGKYVYPKYQQIKGQSGRNAVELHLDYVHDHINDWNRHTNIAKYLEKAVDDYMRKNKM